MAQQVSSCAQDIRLDVKLVSSELLGHSHHAARGVVDGQSKRRDAAFGATAVLEQQRAPMRFGNLSRENETDSRSLRLRREKGNEQVRAARQSWSLVLYNDRYCAVLACPTDTNIATGVERGIDRVAQKVDEQLIE